MSTIGGERVKSTWVTRHVPRDLPVIWEPPSGAIAGDLLLCEVVHTGLHGRVETASGSRRKLYAGDRIVCALANRYATSLLEAVARTDGDHADMVAASGLCGKVVTRTSKASNPTRLHLLGRAHVGSDPLNLRGLPRPVPGPPGSEPRWIVVVGSAMDSGKTTACASVIRGLVDAGHTVAAAKLTGTASGRDYGAFRDAGADPVVDFLDAGWASTAGCTQEELNCTADYLFARVRAASVDWGVVEIADGLLQRETRMLLEIVRSATLDADIVVTTRESLSAVAAAKLLASFGLRTVALSGLFTNSPLARQEAETSSNMFAVRTSELGTWFAQRATQRAAENAAGPVTANPVDRMRAARS
jgi:hypothetical protein